MVNREKEFDADQLAEIDIGLGEGLDVSCYAKKEFLAIQMFQIRLGIEEGLDVSVYASTEFDWFQMEEIRKGMLDGVSYKLYAKPSIAYDKMREIRKGLKDGMDLSGFANLNAGILRQLRKSIAAKVSIIDYITEGYVEEQLEEIRTALEKGLPIRKYLSNEFRGIAIREICKGLENGIDPAIYVSMDYDWKQMREIRLGLEHRIDVSLYVNSLFSWQQMREIRLGLEEGLDVAPYRSFMYVAADMKNIREALLAGSYEQGGYEQDEQLTSDAEIVVFVSSDEMEAYAEIRCDRNKTISSEKIMETLKEYGVSQGIIKENIERIVREKRYRESVLIARGKAPVQGENGWYEYFFNIDLDRSPEVLADGSVDYTSLKWFETVEQGQKIAFYHEAKFGTAGYTVTGRFLASKKGKEKNVLSGKGFKCLDDGRTYVAALTGKIQLVSDNRIEISKLCVLDEVTLATGNIDFDGSILIRGDVGSGVVVRATDDIIVNGSVEAAKLYCGGEMLLRQGVHGSGEGILEAGKKVVGSFFEFANAVSGGDIEAGYSLNSNLNAEGWIIINGSKGTLAGGIASATKGVKSYNVGNRAKLPTILKLGMNEGMLKEKLIAETKIKEINRELAVLENSYSGFQKKYLPEVRNTMDIYMKIENAIYTKELELDALNKTLEAYEQKIQDTEGAKAVIQGTLYEGTTIYIDNIRFSGYDVQDVTARRVQNKVVLQPN